MTTDARSRRVALVPDRLFNPGDDAGWSAAYDLLVAQGVGLIALPPATIDPNATGAAVEFAIDQIEAFSAGSYRVVWLRDDDATIVEARVRAECERRGLALPTITRAMLGDGSTI